MGRRRYRADGERPACRALGRHPGRSKARAVEKPIADVRRRVSSLIPPPKPVHRSRRKTGESLPHRELHGCAPADRRLTEAFAADSTRFMESNMSESEN